MTWACASCSCPRSLTSPATLTSTTRRLVSSSAACLTSRLVFAIPHKASLVPLCLCSCWNNTFGRAASYASVQLSHRLQLLHRQQPAELSTRLCIWLPRRNEIDLPSCTKHTRLAARITQNAALAFCSCSAGTLASAATRPPSSRQCWLWPSSSAALTGASPVSVPLGPSMLQQHAACLGVCVSHCPYIFVSAHLPGRSMQS